MLRHRSGRGYKKNYAALKVPKNTVASIILNGRGLEPPRRFLEEGRLAKLSNRRAKNLMVIMTELQSSPVEMGEPSGITTISADLYQAGLYGRVARRKPLLCKRHIKSKFICHVVRGPNTTGVDLTVKCLLTGPNQQCNLKHLNQRY